jgi:hypothetical protein
LGELQRRVGLYAESAAWFKAAQEFAPPQLQIWATEQLENLPKAQRDGLLPDSELLLVHKAKTSLKKLKPTQMALDPRSLQPAQVKRWMEEVSLATIQYRRTYKLDPESLEELHELNLLKGQPDLTKASLRFFQLKIDTKVNIASLRYTLNCIIPFSDQDGFYTIAYQKGKFHRHSSLN